MQIKIKSTKFELSPALRIYTEETLGRLEPLLKRMETKQDFLLRAELARSTGHHKKGDIYYAEGNLKIGKKLLRAEAENWDLRLAVNEVYRELAREIKKFKGKQEVKRRKTD